MNILVALLIFTVIVVIHELGHFLLAKKNGVGVPEFSVGMGPRLITVAKGKKGFIFKLFCSQKYFENNEDWQECTKYSWKLLPIGGSCAMVGEDEINEDENSFNVKGKWARFSIVFAGPFFNFILAFVFSVIILANAGIDYPIIEHIYDNQPAASSGLEVGDVVKSINGKKITIGRNNNRNGNDRRNRPSMGDTPINAKETRNGKEKSFKIDPNYKTYLFGFSYGTNEKAAAEVSSVTEGKPFEKAGFKAGDIIKEVNGKKIVNAGELSTAMNEVNSDGKEVTFLVDRKGEEKTFKVTPEPYSTKTLGFIASMDEKSKSTFDVVKYSFVEVKYWIETTVGSLGALITGNVSIKNVSGPVGIVDTVGDAINQSKSYGFKVVMLQILYMSVLLSANLGVMNLLPLPALDGGRIVFILIEAIRGKPVDKEKEGFVHFAGFVVLMLFMVFVMYNDIIKILH